MKKIYHVLVQFYLSKVFLLFDGVFLLQAKKIKEQRLEKREQLHLL